MNRYQSIMGRINYVLFLSLVVLLPFPQVCLRYVFVIWLVSWLLEGRWLHRPKPIRENRMFIPLLLFGLWYLWRIVSVLWAADHAAWAWQIERYLAFAVIIPIGIWGVNRNYDWRTAGKVLVGGCVAAIPLYIATMSVLYKHPELIAYMPFEKEWTSATVGWFAFFSENISYLKHRLFLCSVELFGVVIAYQLWRKRPAVLIPAILVMLSCIPLTGSRQSILTAAGLMAVTLVYELPRRYRMRYGVGILLLGIVLGFGVLNMHPRMQNFDYTDLTEIRDVSGNHNMRINIWGIALQQPSDYLVHGLGAGQSTQYMISKYKELKFNNYANRQFNAHNQYLEEVIEIGIPGLLLFLLAWLSVPLCARRQGILTALLFTTIYVMNMLTDCMFGRFCGIALWAVGLLFIFLQSDPQRQE